MKDIFFSRYAIFLSDLKYTPPKSLIFGIKISFWYLKINVKDGILVKDKKMFRKHVSFVALTITAFGCTYAEMPEMIYTR